MTFQCGFWTSSADTKEFASAFAELVPGMADIRMAFMGLLGQGLRPTFEVHVHELHHAVHPRRSLVAERWPPEGHDDLRAAAMNLAAPDLNDPADRDGYVTAKVEDALEDEVGVEARGAVGRRISGLQGERQKRSCVESAVMIGVAGQDESVRHRLGVVRVRRCHAHPIPECRSQRGRIATGLGVEHDSSTILNARQQLTYADESFNLRIKRPNRANLDRFKTVRIDQGGKWWGGS